jgi:hypothetical protein
MVGCACLGMLDRVTGELEEGYLRQRGGAKLSGQARQPDKLNNQQGKP